jgi:hypothetical protein
MMSRHPHAAQLEDYAVDGTSPTSASTNLSLCVDASTAGMRNLKSKRRKTSTVPDASAVQRFQSRPPAAGRAAKMTHKATGTGMTNAAAV